MEISKLDSNFAVETTLTEPDLCLLDVRREPFDIYGLYKPYEGEYFIRLPEDVAAATSSGVAALNRQTAGGRVRFTTDSPYIAIKAVMREFHHMAHMPLLGSSGFDLYIDNDAGSRFVKSFIPPTRGSGGYESIIRFGSRESRSLTINFPLYNDVVALYVGVADGSTLSHGKSYRYAAPVVYYGSSITQGGCASRPGNAYQAMISRRLDCDHINLGFSGNGKAEDAIVGYMASLDMLVFVSDYDHNAKDAEYLYATHYKMYEKLRAAHPAMPYIIVSRPDFDTNYSESVLRREAVYDTYRRAVSAGDRRVIYIDGQSIFRGRFEDSCTVDGSHPNDLGFSLMADAIGHEIMRALRDM